MKYLLIAGAVVVVYLIVKGKVGTCVGCGTSKPKAYVSVLSDTDNAIIQSGMGFKKGFV